MKIFLAIATGQNQANLAPILTFGQPGDHVVWLESSFIKSKDLTADRPVSFSNVAFRANRWRPWRTSGGYPAK